MKIARMMSRRSIARGLTAVVAGVTAAVVATTPAFASGWAPLTRTLWLASAPTQSGSAYSMRDIYLEAGTYTWTVSLDNNSYRIGYSEADRALYLAAGNYHWECSVTSASNGMYQNSCSLNAGSGAAYLTSPWYILPGSGYYDLESYLYKQ